MNDAPARPPPEAASDVASERGAPPAAWVPSAYLAEGIPFAMVIWVAATMFKDLGHGDAEITLATSSILLAWSLKPLWAGFLDMARTKRFFVLAMQHSMAVVLGAIALAVQLPSSFDTVIAALWALAFLSATHDICVDGVFITSLDRGQQARWIGIQGIGWNCGRIFGTAFVVGLAGVLQERFGWEARDAWSAAIGASGAALAGLGALHGFTLPVGSRPVRPRNAREVWRSFASSLGDFLRKPALPGMLVFVLLYRSGEGLLLAEAPLFLQAPLAEGGLGLSLVEKSWIDGTISTAVSLLGGLAGGAFVARYGLRRSMLFMALCVNLPNLCFVYLSWAVTPQAPLSLATVGALVTLEKFAYSFGFIANMLYMMQQIAPGPYPMTHYAFCTAIMNLVLVPTQMASGPLAEWLGYRSFFVLVVFASIPSVIAARYAPFRSPDPRTLAPKATAEDASSPRGETASTARHSAESISHSE